MNHLYDLLSKLYCSELFDYLDGFDCTTQLFNRYEQFTFYGLTMLLSSIGIAAIYYFAINHPRWNHRGHWLLFLALAVVVNFLIGFYFTNDDLTNGNLNSRMCERDKHDSCRLALQNFPLFFPLTAQNRIT